LDQKSQSGATRSLKSAHRGYEYQDLVGAYIVAEKIASGEMDASFLFDQKKTPTTVPDKFDDITIYGKDWQDLIQIKHSSARTARPLKMSDFTRNSPSDLALHRLFETWRVLNSDRARFRICVTWSAPQSKDSLWQFLEAVEEYPKIFADSRCFRLNLEALWPLSRTIHASWLFLEEEVSNLSRAELARFVGSLTIEVGCPNSQFQDSTEQGLDGLLRDAVERIGVGTYPNDHTTVRQLSKDLCAFVSRKRAQEQTTAITCHDIAVEVGIRETLGGFPQAFPVDRKNYVETKDRVAEIRDLLNKNRLLVLTAEPGAGKSWLIEELDSQLPEYSIVKHFCYVGLDDQHLLRRITTNVMYGNLLTQLIEANHEGSYYKSQRYASNKRQLEEVLGQVTRKTLLVVDGIDHVWRVYQKNRGGMPEDETKILEALATINFENPNVSVLVLSQPIEELDILKEFKRHTLEPLNEEFVRNLLQKHSIRNIVVGSAELSSKISLLSKGNALYCKYLVEHARANEKETSFRWLDVLPPYDFNLSGYYQYLFEQAEDSISFSAVLCGADFFLTERELRDITHQGDYVDRQLRVLKPVLRFQHGAGYLVYHESFKRYVVDRIFSQNASVAELVYRPLANWLGGKDFFSYPKAYANLLRLWFELDRFEDIAGTISEKFVEMSLLSAHPFYRISENHRLQKASLRFAHDLRRTLIVTEQTKVVYELELYMDGGPVGYLEAVQAIHGVEGVYRVLKEPGDERNNDDQSRDFLIEQALRGNKEIPWSLVEEGKRGTDPPTRYALIKSLHLQDYISFDLIVQERANRQKNGRAWQEFLVELTERWSQVYGTSWIDKTNFFRSWTISIVTDSPSLTVAINRIATDDGFSYADDWLQRVRDVSILASKASDTEIERVTLGLQDHSWFRNWLQYLVRIAHIARKGGTEEQILEAFRLLSRDLDPFKGKPRACDLYKQTDYIHRSFRQGLELCAGSKYLVEQCFQILERVTATAISLDREFSGPLTREAFLRLSESYLDKTKVLAMYIEEYSRLAKGRYYLNVADIAFRIVVLETTLGQTNEANHYFAEAVQLMTAYGFRKDRTLSELLDASVSYQKAYGQHDDEWYLEVGRMALAVASHTDGRSTKSYPLEWFEEFGSVFPDAAIRYLICATLEAPHAVWHQETQLLHLLEDRGELFSATQWFLLAKSLPLANSDDILFYGISKIASVDDEVRKRFRCWLESLPSLSRAPNGPAYRDETRHEYLKTFGREMPSGERRKEPEPTPISRNSIEVLLPSTDFESAMAFLETSSPTAADIQNIRTLFDGRINQSEKIEFLIELAREIRWREEDYAWLDLLFEIGTDDWEYLQVSLFICLTDGWYRGLNHLKHLEKPFLLNPISTLEKLSEVLGFVVATEKYHISIAGNLVHSLSTLGADASVVHPLFDTIFALVSRRIPHRPDHAIDHTAYLGLGGLSRDELVVALLLSRLKTLTAEKTQGVLWSLLYIAKTSAELLFRPFTWIFGQGDKLLPIHRAVLLQILLQSVKPAELPIGLSWCLLQRFPSGYFLEDQYLRGLLGSSLQLDSNSARALEYPGNEADDRFFAFLHPKYSRILFELGGLSGSFEAFRSRRNVLQEEFGEFWTVRSHRVVTPLVVMSNAVYEIANRTYYSDLVFLLRKFGETNILGLGFWLDEVRMQESSLGVRPKSIPSTQQVPRLAVREIDSPLRDGDWTVLAFSEIEYFGETFGEKTTRKSTHALSYSSGLDGSIFSEHLFLVSDYFNISFEAVAELENPIRRLEIFDNLESCELLFLSPGLISALGLHASQGIDGEFVARDSQGKDIVKIVSWRQDYFGDVDEGIELPGVRGISLLIRSDMYGALIGHCRDDCRFILKAENTVR
jgi:hypothetical protein